MANEVKVTFAGDEKDLASAFDRVGEASEGMASKVERTTTTIRESGGAARDWQDRFDTLDQGAMGFRDTLTGVQDSMAGWNALTTSSEDAVNRVNVAQGKYDRAVAKHGENSQEAVAAATELAQAQTALSQQQGTLTDKLFLLGTGVGDLASGFANLIVPLTAISVQQIKTTATMVAGWASTAASAVASVATQIASWIALGVQSLISAAQVALAWLISMGPIILVIAAVIGLVAIIIANWDTIKAVIAAGWEFVKAATLVVWDAIKATVSTTIGAIVTVVTTYLGIVRAVWSAAWGAVQAVASAVWNGIKATISTTMSGAATVIRTYINVVLTIFRTMRSGISAILSGLASAITAPFRTGFSGIKAIWNSTLGGRGFSVPGWVPGIGGREFRIPRLAQGGIVMPSPGGSLVNAGEGGEAEAVVPLSKLGQMIGGGGGGAQELVIRSDGSPVGDFILELLRPSVQHRGGVTLAFGGR